MHQNKINVTLCKAELLNKLYQILSDCDSFNLVLFILSLQFFNPDKIHYFHAQDAFLF